MSLTKKEKIHNHLKTGQTLTTLEAIKKYNLTYLRELIYQLRQEYGDDYIDSRPRKSRDNDGNETTYAEYFIPEAREDLLDQRGDKYVQESYVSDGRDPGEQPSETDVKPSEPPYMNNYPFGIQSKADNLRFYEEQFAKDIEEEKDVEVIIDGEVHKVDDYLIIGTDLSGEPDVEALILYDRESGRFKNVDPLTDLTDYPWKSGDLDDFIKALGEWILKGTELEGKTENNNTFKPKDDKDMNPNRLDAPIKRPSDRLISREADTNREVREILYGMITGQYLDKLDPTGWLKVNKSLYLRVNNSSGNITIASKVKDINEHLFKHSATMIVKNVKPDLKDELEFEETLGKALDIPYNKSDRFRTASAKYVGEDLKEPNYKDDGYSPKS